MEDIFHFEQSLSYSYGIPDLQVRISLPQSKKFIHIILARAVRCPGESRCICLQSIQNTHSKGPDHNRGDTLGTQRASTNWENIGCSFAKNKIQHAFDSQDNRTQQCDYNRGGAHKKENRISIHIICSQSKVPTETKMT